jgi:PAS domain S-box-containing protein
MEYSRMNKKQLIECIRDLRKREEKFLKGTEKDYLKILLDDFNRKQDELELRNEQMADMQTQLEISREKYVGLYDNAPVGYLTLNEKGIIDDVNYAGSILLGADILQIKGFPFNVFIDNQFINNYLTYFRQCLRSTEKLNFRFKLRNGKYVSAVTSPQPFNEKIQYMMILNDISEIKKAEENNEFLASIVEHSGDAIISCNVDGEIISWNKGAERMYGYNASEAAGRGIAIIYPLNAQKEYLDIIRLAEEKGNVEHQTRHVTRNGRVIDVSISVSIINTNGMNTHSLVIISRDISSQVHYEETLTKSLREKELLLKEIHHRVKNNLQLISSLLNLQRSHITSESDAQLFNETQNRIRAMAIVHEKLYLSGENAKININDYISEITRYQHMFFPLSSKHIHLNLDIADILVNIDMAIAIGLIINELITNSIKHAFRDLDAGRISISIGSNEGNVFIKYSDNGAGISDEYTEGKETLGWIIIKSLVDQHDGIIERKTDKGTQFLITMRE